MDRHDTASACLMLRVAARLCRRPTLLARLAWVAMRTERYALAIDSLREAASATPAAPSNWRALAGIYAELKYPQAARHCADAALRARPADAGAHVALAAAHRIEGCDDSALAELRFALSCPCSRRMSAVAYLKLADLYMDRADRDEMIACCLRAIEQDPTASLAYFQLAHAGYYTDHAYAHLETMERHCRNAHLAPDERANFHFALGFAYDQHDCYERAFYHFTRGNGLAKRHFDPRRAMQDVDRRINVFTAERIQDLSRYGSQDDRLIVVAGMPRSGTTLVEQILDSHTQIVGLGERSEIFDATEAFARELSWTGKPYPECIAYLTSDVIERVSRQMLASLRRGATNARRIVTKRPDDFAEFGLMRILFPRATLVHCRRHPVDTCLSCFMQNFREVPYASRLTHLEAYYRGYRRLMQHWMSLPGGRKIHEILYEELVFTPDSAIRSLLDACDVPNEDACVTFFKNTRPVGTASVWQVRQPIYTRSVGRWRHYAPFLGPLLRLLPDGQVDSMNTSRRISRRGSERHPPVPVWSVSE